MRQRLAVAAMTAIALTGTACESTFDKAARRERAQQAAIAATKLEITANAAVEAKVAKILTGADGTAAIVVELTSHDVQHGLLWAPIDVQMRDATGAVVAETNVDGADPALVHVPYVPAGGRSFYVNDLLTPTAPPVSATVTLGGTPIALPGTLPELEVTAKYVDDPDYGALFEGTVTNATGIRQEQVIVQVVARRGEEIVAAGTSIVKGLDPGVSQPFQGAFVGDPRGAKLTVSAPISNIAGQAGAPAG
jgi:hypothetical protein